MLAPLPTARNNLEVVFVAGNLYAIGGGVGYPWDTTAVVEVYDPLLEAWSSGPSLSAGKAAFGAGVDGLGRIYAFGGVTGTGAAHTSSVERLDPSIINPADPGYGW